VGSGYFVSCVGRTKWFASLNCMLIQALVKPIKYGKSTGEWRRMAA